MISFKKVLEKLNEDSFPSVCNRFNLVFKSLNRFNLFNDFIVIDDEIVMKILFHLFGSKFPNYFSIIFKKVAEKLNEDSFPSVWNRFNLEFKSLNKLNFFSDFIVIDDEIVMKILFHYFFL